MENEQDRKETKDILAKHIFDISRLTFVALVLGGAVFIFQSSEISLTPILMVVFGIIVTLTFSWLGNNLMK
ncbi:hypothetical protein Barb6_00704 [Bacteroidales bacterium Barb6]|nr:hypothetical protein Barb6_00704 [Bacteroidales bacterium Barb6]